MEKVDHLYSGKAKTVFNTTDSEKLVLCFRDDATAFNGEKHDQLQGKGMVNNKFNAFIMQVLSKNGIDTHFESMLSDNETLVKRLDMLPIECVIRNVAAGSICKRLGIEKGTECSPPIFEFFYKDDELGDPMINESHILTFGWADKKWVTQAKTITHKVNDILKPLFLDVGLMLVDYKLEFGVYKDKLLLGDEFTPDGCRLWDIKTDQSFDKDRFRNDLGDVIASYQAVGERLGIKF